MDKEQICGEMDRVRNDYRELLDTATVAELRQPTDGTKWNNEQLLFHMLFGYLVVRNLRLLVWGFSRLPDGVSRRFAALLNAGTRPFHVINYIARCSVRALWDTRAWSVSWIPCSAAFRRPCEHSRSEPWTGACISRSAGTPTSPTT